MLLAAAASTGNVAGQPLLRSAVAILLIVSTLVAVHVAIGGEGLTADLAREGSLPRVDQHVAVQRAEGREHLPTQAAVVHFCLT